MNIVTHYDPTPIPDRRFDWVAYDDDTYDGMPGRPIGYGATRQQAIENFLAEYEAFGPGGIE